jgi:hypothetical protein
MVTGVLCQDWAGRLWDVLTVPRFATLRRSDGRSEVRFGVHVRRDNHDRAPPLVRLRAVCAITIEAVARAAPSQDSPL